MVRQRMTHQSVQHVGREHRLVAGPRLRGAWRATRPTLRVRETVDLHPRVPARDCVVGRVPVADELEAFFPWREREQSPEYPSRRPTIATVRGSPRAAPKSPCLECASPPSPGMRRGVEAVDEPGT